MKSSVTIAILILLAFLQTAQAQNQKIPDTRLIICLLPLAHADARQLAAVLAPLLSPQGSLVPYEATNTLIIKDRPSVVRQLVKAIKGKAQLSACQNIADTDEDKNQ